MQKIKLHIIAKNKVSRDNLTLFFNQSSLHEVCSSSQNLKELMTYLKYEKSKTSDILLANIKHKELADSAFLNTINILASQYKIIIMSMFEEEHLMYDGVKNGAICFLSSNQTFSEISNAIEVVSNGGTLITPSFGREVLKQVHGVKNISNISILESFVYKKRMVEIAEQLNNSAGTIYQKVVDVFKSIYTEKLILND